MNDELLFRLAVELTIAKIRTHFISPTVDGWGQWVSESIDDDVRMLRRSWNGLHKEGNVKRFE